MLFRHLFAGSLLGLTLVVGLGATPMGEGTPRFQARLAQRQSNPVTVVSGKGIPGLVRIGEKGAKVKKRLGKPSKRSKGEGLLWYKRRGLIIDAPYGRVEKIWTSNPLYQTEAGIRVGDTFGEVQKAYKNLEPFLFVSDRGDLPSRLVGFSAPDQGIDFLSKSLKWDLEGPLSAADKAQKVEFIVWR